MIPHTQGPWIAIEGRTGEISIRAEWDKNYEILALIDFTCQDKPNAILMASAPEMLETLNQVYKVSRNKRCKVMKKIKRIIAMAEGRPLKHADEKLRE